MLGSCCTSSYLNEISQDGININEQSSRSPSGSSLAFSRKTKFWTMSSFQKRTRAAGVNGRSACDHLSLQAIYEC
eukprot:4419926-Pleurochrysis_carterae.AAC.3